MTLVAKLRSTTLNSTLTEPLEAGPPTPTLFPLAAGVPHLLRLTATFTLWAAVVLLAAPQSLRSTTLNSMLTAARALFPLMLTPCQASFMWPHLLQPTAMAMSYEVMTLPPRPPFTMPPLMPTAPLALGQPTPTPCQP